MGGAFPKMASLHYLQDAIQQQNAPPVGSGGGRSEMWLSSLSAAQAANTQFPHTTHRTLTASWQGRRQIGDVALQLLCPALKLLGRGGGGRTRGKGQQLGVALEGGLVGKEGQRNVKD